MNITTTFARNAVAAACLSLFSVGAFAAGAVSPKNWTSTGSNNPEVGVGDSLQVLGYTANANNWTDNESRLYNGAWPHSGGSPWFTFYLSEAGSVKINVTNATNGKAWTPGFTVWSSNGQFDGGTGNADANVKETGLKSGINAPHSFNQVGQIGDYGTAWMSGADGNMTSTLAYANSGVAHTDASANDWGQVINYGVNAVGYDAYFVQGGVGNGWAWMNLSDLQAGWYTIFVGGACTACGASTFNMDLTVAAVPEPETYAMMAAGLALVGGAARRRARRA